VLWVLFVFPNAAVSLPPIVGLILGLVLLGLAAALATAGTRTLAGVFVVVVLVNQLFMILCNQ